MSTEKPSSIERACTTIKSAGLRITQPRISILRTMYDNPGPSTIEAIHKSLGIGACDLVTVYRCLAVFEELSLVRRCYFHNGTSLYEVVESPEPTYHVVNKDGNAVERLDPETAAELRKALEEVEEKLKARGFEKVSHMVEFFAESKNS